MGKTRQQAQELFQNETTPIAAPPPVIRHGEYPTGGTNAGPYCNHSCTAELSYLGISRGLGAEFSGARKGVGPHLLLTIQAHALRADNCQHVGTRPAFVLRFGRSGFV